VKTVLGDVPRAGSLIIESQPDHPMNSAQSTRIRELDGLRGIAIALVLIWHYFVPPLIQSGIPAFHALGRLGALSWSGVDLFFVLSGFLIGGILVESKGSQSFYRTFYTRRAFRILPIYALLTASPLILRALAPQLVHGASGIFGQPYPWLVSVLFLQSVWIAPVATWPNMFLGPTWSLSVEEQFYLTLPFVVRNVRMRTLGILCCCTIGIAPLVRWWAFRHIGPLAPYTLVVCRADSLMFGVLAAIAIRKRGAGDIFGKATTRILILSTGVFGGTACVLAIANQGIGTSAMSTVGFSVLAAFYTSLLLLALSPRPSLYREWLRIGALVKLGTVAYCVYLIHLPVLAVTNFISARWGGISSLSPFFGALAGLLCTLALAAVSWRFMEKPLISIGHGVASDSSFSSSPLQNPRSKCPAGRSQREAHECSHG
jgi:peptidoglycan/LPS O-acetylase OafA/YrhL